jgi:hypothetical protein
MSKKAKATIGLDADSLNTIKKGIKALRNLAWTYGMNGKPPAGPRTDNRFFNLASALADLSKMLDDASIAA